MPTGNGASGRANDPQEIRSFVSLFPRPQSRASRQGYSYLEIRANLNSRPFGCQVGGKSDKYKGFWFRKHDMNLRPALVSACGSVHGDPV